MYSNIYRLVAFLGKVLSCVHVKTKLISSVMTPLGDYYFESSIMHGKHAQQKEVDHIKLMWVATVAHDNNALHVP